MITMSQKMILSFLLSVFLFTGIVVLIFFNIFDLGAAISVFPQRVQVLILPAFFLALFFIIFSYINLRQYPAEENEVVELEDISTGSGGNTPILGRLFAFSPVNLELLQGAGNDVIYEHNGIHYISDDAFNSDKYTEREINKDFAKLVESVINRVNDI